MFQASALPRDCSQAAIDALVQAVTDRRTLEIDYASRNSGQRVRRVDPYGLDQRYGLYCELHAWDHGREKILTFALDRVHAAFPTADPFERDESAWEAFRHQPAAYGRATPSLWRP